MKVETFLRDRSVTAGQFHLFMYFCVTHIGLLFFQVGVGGGEERCQNLNLWSRLLLQLF